MNKWAAVFKFLKAAMSEAPSAAGQEGTASFSRLSAGAVVVAVLVWVSYVVFRTHGIPDLSGPSLFLTSGAAATYGANKVTTAVSNAVTGRQDATDNKAQAGN